MFNSWYGHGVGKNWFKNLEYSLWITLVVYTLLCNYHEFLVTIMLKTYLIGNSINPMHQNNITLTLIKAKKWSVMLVSLINTYIFIAVMHIMRRHGRVFSEWNYTTKRLVDWANTTSKQGDLLCFFTPMTTQIARFIGPTWGPPGAARTQVGPMLATWTLISGHFVYCFNASKDCLCHRFCLYTRPNVAAAMEGQTLKSQHLTAKTKRRGSYSFEIWCMNTKMTNLVHHWLKWQERKQALINKFPTITHMSIAFHIYIYIYIYWNY